MTIRNDGSSEEDFDEDFDEETNEDADDSENTEGEADDQDASKTENGPADDTADDDESTKYRPSDSKEEKKAPQMVPLKKYTDLKAKLRDLQKEEQADLSNETLEEFAEEFGIKPNAVKKLAKLITTQAIEEATRVAEERVKPLVQERVSIDNSKAFEADFQKNIASKYPELATQIEVFRNIAFSKDFIHLKSLEAIKTEFYPNVKASQKEVKKESVEGGSQGAGKETERIEFATLKDNPKQYAKVMNDPVARGKYYEWQDSQVD
jgi:hypothetical protein